MGINNSSLGSWICISGLAVTAGVACGSSSATGGATPNDTAQQARDDAGSGSSAQPADGSGGDGSAPGVTVSGEGGPSGPSAEGGRPVGSTDASAAGGAEATAPVDPTAEVMQVHADDAIETLMLNFWPNLRSNTSSYDWKYAHYWDAVLDATERRGPNAFSGTARMFYELQAKRGWLDNFYDDESWITLALLHAYKVTGDAMYLTQAKFVYADIMKAWDTTCCGAHPGGLWWQKPTNSKATASNAGPVIAGARLYEATQDATYLSFAQKAYDYWSKYMVDASSGHVYDSISNNGSINTSWSFTYNEGLFIGAVVELAQATGDKSNMPLAHKVAGYMMSHETETVSSGTILSDGACQGDGEMFKGIGARYLKELYEADPSHTEYRDFLQRSGNAAWTLARNSSTGDISCDWKGPFSSATGDVGSLGSAAIGLAAAAEALGPGIQRPALAYEAEEGDLHNGINLAASNAGFSGWAYLSNWGSDGQSVDFLVDVPAAGNYMLAWRYATAADAVRALSVNGQVTNASVAFPSTGGNGTYTTASGTATLTAGHNTITLAFSASQGSHGNVNLDRLQLTPP